VNYFARLVPAKRSDLSGKSIRCVALIQSNAGGAGAMKKATAKKAGSSSSAKGAAKKASQPSTKGCCTIYDNKKDEQVEGVTKAECTRLAKSSRRGWPVE
jgi:hypothetical protein